MWNVVRYLAVVHGCSYPVCDNVRRTLIVHFTQVRHIEERQADTIMLNGSTVEVIRDTSRHGSSAYGGYGAAADGGAYHSHSAHNGANVIGASAHVTAGDGGGIAASRIGGGHRAGRHYGNGHAMFPLVGQPLGEAT